MPKIETTIDDVMEIIQNMMEVIQHVNVNMATKDDIADVRRDMATNIADVRRDMATKDDIANLRSDINSEIRSLKQELKGDIKKLGDQLSDDHRANVIDHIKLKKRVDKIEQVIQKQQPSLA